MPARNRIKTYIEGGYYHVYNRGVEKRKIFLDEQDYKIFLYLLKTYLSPPMWEQDNPWHHLPPPRINLHGEVTLLAYALLPNHFHLLLSQRRKESMTRLMRALTTSYVLYFNRKYDRVGTLFQDRYKAAWVGEGTAGDAYLLHLSRYIHLNPKIELAGVTARRWPYSSYQHYLGKVEADWVQPSRILAYFAQAEQLSRQQAVAAYRRFVESIANDPKELVGQLAIE